MTDSTDLQQKNDVSDSADPFGDLEDDGEVAAIAQRFEAKYGPKAFHSGKKKRTQDMDDYFDLGDGYDEDDPFIDNTEAYDEVVPSSLTTKHGGFYINQGKLDFKSLTTDSSMEDFASPPGMKKKKKQILESDSEEETGEALAKKFKAIKRKKLMEKREGEKKKKLLNGQDGAEVIVKKKRKKNSEKLRLKKLSESAVIAKEEKGALVASSTTTASVATSTSPSVTSSSTSPVTCSSSITTPVTTATPVNSIAVCDPGSKKPSQPEETEAVSGVEESPSNLQDAMKEDSSSRSGTEEKGDQAQGDKTSNLPSQLPADLAEAIDSIKKEAKERKEGKSKFFSTEVNRLLLDIELGSKNLPWGSRTAIYNHLGEHLPCGKQAIQRRAKKLRESQQEDQLKGPIQKLREAVLKVMPGLEEQHEAEIAKAKLEAKDEPNDTTKEEASTESEGEEKQDARKKSRGPRKKFCWTREIKQLLLDVVSTKMNLYSTCKSRNETAEEYLKNYLDAEIRPIWPPGWMQTRILFKESRAAHEDLTKLMKTKKPIVGKPYSPSPETAPSNQESSRTHISKTEDVIEISSVLDRNSEEISDVVVNLPNSEPISAFPSPKVVPQRLPSPTSFKNHLSKTSTKIPLTQPVVSINMMPNVSEKAYKYVDVKRVTPVPVSETLDSTKSSTTGSFRNVTTSKSSTPTSTSTSTTLPSASLGASATSASPANVSNRSFIEAFDDFLNDAYYGKGDPSPSGKKTDPVPFSQLQLQKQTSYQQQKLFSQQQQQQQKVSTLQQKSGASQQQKLPQELKLSSPSQKAAVSSASSMVVNKEQRNSSWSNVNSIFPSEKSISPVVAMNRIPSNFPGKLSVSGTGKHSHSSSQNHSLTVQSQQQKGKTLGSSSHKPQQNFSLKKQSVTGSTSPSQHQVSSRQNFPSPNSNVSRKSESSGRSPGTSPGNGSLSMQRATVLGTSVQDFLQKQQQKVGNDSTPPSSQSASRLLLDTNLSKATNVMKQPSPVDRHTASHLIPPTLGTNLSVNSAATPTPTSVSRTSTPSPQKSPVSPNNAALSLYEQIQSQIRTQEAMEGQALKNLAMALSLGGPNSGPGLKGKKPRTVGMAGSPCQLNSDNSSSNNAIESVSGQALPSNLRTKAPTPPTGTKALPGKVQKPQSQVLGTHTLSPPAVASQTTQVVSKSLLEQRKFVSNTQAQSNVKMAKGTSVFDQESKISSSHVSQIKMNLPPERHATSKKIAYSIALTSEKCNDIPTSHTALMSANLSPSAQLSPSSKSLSSSIVLPCMPAQNNVGLSSELHGSVGKSKVSATAAFLAPGKSSSDAKIAHRMTQALPSSRPDISERSAKSKHQKQFVGITNPASVIPRASLAGACSRSEGPVSALAAQKRKHAVLKDAGSHGASQLQLSGASPDEGFGGGAASHQGPGKR